ncbi:lysophospholipase II [Xylaria arbuscula]|nr:lysophospholipase II [Xylaria arbuscula]
MATDTIFIVEPKAAHTHTVIFLHGRDSNCKQFADELFESEASEPAGQPRTLRDLFPNVRWVFPGAPVLWSERFDTDMSQWFDMWSVEHPTERLELQYPGLQQSMQTILGVIEKEELSIPRKRIFLAGISQGFTTVLTAFLAATPQSFAGLIGLCSWMPPSIPTEKYPSVIDESNRCTPIFLSHSADDDVVPVKDGRELRYILQLLGFQVEWNEYETGGHWVHEPRGVDGIARFMKRHMLGSN